MNTPKSNLEQKSTINKIQRLAMASALVMALLAGAPGCKQGAKNEKQTPQTEQTTETKDLIAHAAGNSSANTKDPSAGMDASNPADMMNNSAEGEEWSEEDFGKLMEVVDVEIENEYLEEENKKLDEQNKKLDEQNKKLDEQNRKDRAEILKRKHEIEKWINSLSVEELLAVDGIEKATHAYMEICKGLNETPNPKMVTVQRKLLANR
ncbi:hypothetical protein BSK20_02575 [SR1 bacterium human oral taxon HOT-345]|nr:hypothetical protein BSK20_02575 [SR1 bacterium human oral taxon HOT-345]